MSDKFVPRIIAFLCKWCSSAGSDLAGVSRMEYPANVVPITVMCSRVPTARLRRKAVSHPSWSRIQRSSPPKRRDGR